jgi:hypothetical protein
MTTMAIYNIFVQSMPRHYVRVGPVHWLIIQTVIIIPVCAGIYEGRLKSS